MHLLSVQLLLCSHKPDSIQLRLCPSELAPASPPIHASNDWVDEVAHALPWAHMLHYLPPGTVAAVRLTSRGMRSAVDHATTHIHVRGAAAAAGLVAHNTPHRLPNLTRLTFSPAHSHSGTAQGGIHDTQAMLQLVRACLHATGGRLVHLEVEPGSHAASTSSTRLAQIFRLPPEAASALFSMHDWTSLSLPINPTVAASTGTVAASMGNSAPCSTSSGTSSRTSTGATLATQSVASAAAGTPPAPPSPKPSTLLIQLLPRTLRSLTLRLTGRLADVSPLVHLAPTLHSLTLVGFSGSTAAHAHSLAALSELKALSLEWVAQHRPVAGGSSMPAAVQQAAPGAVTATQAVQQVWGAAAGGGSSGPPAQGPGLSELGEAGAGHVATTFWGILASGLRKLRTLCARGSEASIDVRGLVMHMHTHPALSRLVLHMDRATDLGPGVLLCLASIPHLTSLSLTYLSFRSDELDVTLSTSTITLQPVYGGMSDTVPLGPGLRGVGEESQQLVRALLCLDSDTWHGYMYKPYFAQPSEAVVLPAVPTHLLSRLTKLDLCHCRSDTVHTLLLLRAASQPAAPASHHTAAAPTSQYRLAHLTLPCTIQSWLSQKHAVQDSWASLCLHPSGDPAVERDGGPAAHHSPPQPTTALAATPPTSTGGTDRNQHIVSTGNSSSLHTETLHHLRVSYPSTYGPCAATWLRSLSYGSLSSSLKHLALEGVLCLSDQLLRQVLEAGVGPQLRVLELRTSATMVSDKGLSSYLTACTRLEACVLDKLLAASPQLLQQMARTCPRLTSLKVGSQCPHAELQAHWYACDAARAVALWHAPARAALLGPAAAANDLLCVSRFNSHAEEQP